MKKFLAFVFALLACSFSMNTAAQELPLVVSCLADHDKSLEQEFCTLIFGAVEVHPGTRHADQHDQTMALMAVIPLETGACSEAIAVSVAVTYGFAKPGAPKFYIYSLVDVVPRGEFVRRAVKVIDHANGVVREWMVRNFPGTEDTATSIRLEASPP